MNLLTTLEELKKNILILCALGLLGLGSLLHAKSQKYDVLVYGATPAGICAAVAASREGASVARSSPEVAKGLLW